MKAALQIEVSFEQILELVRSLPNKQKIQLSKELEKDVIDSKLSKLLEIFRTDKLSLEIIDAEVQHVRREIYDEKKR